MPLSTDPIEVLHPNTPDLSENDSRPESGNSVGSSSMQPGGLTSKSLVRFLKKKYLRNFSLK